MRKVFYGFLLTVLVLTFNSCGFAQEGKKVEGGKVMVLDDFEGAITAGASGTIDAGAGNGSSVEVSADKALKMDGEQSLKIVYDAVSGGYIYVARGHGLDVKGAAAWKSASDQINWGNYGALSFYMYGTGSKARMAFDVKDSGGELFRFIATDDFKGWKQIVCPFSEFFARGDWQPTDATKNAVLDFPIKSFQFEPLAISKGTIYIDVVSLETMN